MASASASTSAAHAFEGRFGEPRFAARADARGRRSSRQRCRGSGGAPPPAWGNQKSRRGSRRDRCRGNQAAGARLLAEAQREQFALLRRESLRGTASRADARRWRRRASRARRSRIFSKWPACSSCAYSRAARARFARDLLVVRAIGQQARRAPRATGAMSCGGTSRDGHHLLVEARLVFLDRVHRQQVRDAHLGFGNSADIGGHHRHAAQHRFQDDARTRLGPQRRHQQHARARQQQVDVVHRLRAGARWGALRATARSCWLVPQVGTAAKAVSRKGVGQRQEDRDALHRAGIDEGDELVVEAAELRPLSPAPSGRSARGRRRFRRTCGCNRRRTG